jgi:hypothetical protein
MPPQSATDLAFDQSQPVDAVVAAGMAAVAAGTCVAAADPQAERTKATITSAENRIPKRCDFILAYLLFEFVLYILGTIALYRIIFFVG